MTSPTKVSIPKKRKFLPNDLQISTWDNISPYFTDLQKREISSEDSLKKWMFDLSELEAVFSEEAAWRYIRMTCDTLNKEYSESYEFFASEIEPKASPFFNEFHRKLIASPFISNLGKDYAVYLRNIRKSVEIYREKNIPLFTTIDIEKQKYGKIVSEMTVEVDGQEITLQQAANYYKNTDRNKREEVFKKVLERRLIDKTTLDGLFDSLIKLRHEVATNADFKNFRDYMFAALGRFDYSIEDCADFHNSVSKIIVPVITSLDQERKDKLGYDSLRPWDTEVDMTGLPAVVPYKDADDLVEKTIECFRRIKPEFSHYIKTMRDLGHFDLDSRKGKAPGGYNYPLYETGIPFIFMNSANSMRDLITMVHEGGHAIHSFVTQELAITDFKSTPSEVAELASMSMELISMEHWDVFISDQKELTRAKKEQLEKVIRGLPWIALVDKFQHWIYENHNHSPQERSKTWREFLSDFESPVLDWTGFEEGRDTIWQRQLHIFEVPFYYIEYGFAQLGAIAVWRNFKRDPEKAIEQYEAALKLGSTRTIPEVYEAAGIRFDFSASYVKELIDFVKAELNSLK